MDQEYISASKIRSALFIDFDNIYIRFKDKDPVIADTFARDPERWLTWLEGDFDVPGDRISIKRKILTRRCYLNPQAFSKLRPYFIKTAFEVKDCPQLTAQGKTSTDIHLVMDVLDALNHPTHFDEFIIFSGDADFTPLLLRLRMNDRFTAILCAGYASPAYKASCDFIISVDEFIRDALGIEYPDEEDIAPILPDKISETTKALLKKMADRIYEEATEPSGIQASELPNIYKRFTEFARSNHWLGFNTLRSLTEAVLEQRNDLIFIEEDPWCVARRKSVERESWELAAAGNDAESAPDIHAAVVSCIEEIVAKSSSPVKMEYLASVIQNRFSEHLADSKWLGAGTFKNLLKRLNLGRLRFSSILTGFVYDPVHHKQPMIMDNFSKKYPKIAPLAEKIHELTETPMLLPEHYRLLFKEIARAVNESGFHIIETSKIVRDRCVEKEASISRANVGAVLSGLRNSGCLKRSKRETPEELSKAFAKHVIRLCRSVQFVLGLSEMRDAWAWITGSDYSKVSAAEGEENNQLNS
jgi:hypothetical protein